MAQLTTAQFQALMLDVLVRFSRDWARHRRTEPELFPEAQPDRLWWDAFAEFASADILNPSLVDQARDD